MTSLSINNLVKEYEKFKLGPISFSISEGEIVGFIGRNGAGKTTTLKSIYDLVKKNSGSIQIFDKEFEDNEIELKQHIGFMLGGVDYYPKTKLKNITKVVKRFYKEWSDETYYNYLKEFSLDEEKRVQELSEGMKVKYNLTLALSHNASLFILDEPTSGLDPVSRDEVTDIFMKLTENKKNSILFSTHITEDLDKCADRIVYIRNGLIVADDNLETFKSGFLLVEGPKENIDKIKDKVIGYRESRNSFEALIKKVEKEEFGEFIIKDADLETIMVLSERGAQNA